MRNRLKTLILLAFFASAGILNACSSEGAGGDQCGESTCNNHGTCDDSSGLVVCTCDAGYSGDDCAQCAQSFTDYGDGECRPLDPCQVDTSCDDQHRACSNNQGVVACGDCLAGYEQASDGTCQPFDPCADETSCAGQLRECVNDQGVATCGDCLDSYTDYGDGECKLADPCRNDTSCEVHHRECVNNRGTATCGDCLAGYHPERDECVEDSGCAENTCNQHGTCDDSTGVVVCDCDDKYTGDHCESCIEGYTDYGDDTCRPADPCADNTECEAFHRACVNHQGVAECGDCLAGYHEDAGLCEADDTKVTVTVLVPDDFTATPVKIAASFYTDPAAEGMPTGRGLIIENPAIGVGQPFVYETTAHKLMVDDLLTDGIYYMSIVLFVEGGNGNKPIPIPKSGVDWMGKVEQEIVLGSPVCDAGSVELYLVP